LVRQGVEYISRERHDGRLHAMRPKTLLYTPTAVRLVAKTMRNFRTVEFIMICTDEAQHDNPDLADLSWIP